VLSLATGAVGVREADTWTDKISPARSGTRHRGTGTGCSKRDHLAPLYVNEGLFPPVDDAPVLAVVKQTALDDGCGPALLQVVGNGSKNGLVGPGW